MAAPPFPAPFGPFFRLLGPAALVWLSLPLVSFGADEANPRQTPLPARTAASGGTLFHKVDAAAAGLVTTNRYQDPTFFGEKFSEFTLGAIGTGLAVADYDLDGKPDLLVVAKTEPTRLFRNLGGFRFEDVTQKAGLSLADGAIWKQGATFADVNNDGRPDLYLCRYDAPNQLWINQGDGTFREEAVARGVAVRDASGMATFCDYDRDGDLDLYLVTNLLSATKAPQGQPDYLFRNDGKGGFTDVTAAAGIRGEGFGHSATWWDFDEDGWPDLYVANDFAGLDTFYRNNRDGTFREALREVFPYTSFSSMGCDLADVDNDGHLDLFVAEMAATERARDQQTMAESRAQLNRPGATTGQALRQVMRNVLFLGTGLPRVREAATLAGLDATDWTWCPLWDDFDNDGKTDLFITNGMVLELHHADLHARIRATERLEDRLAVMKSMPRLDERNLAYRNAGDLRFEENTAGWGLEHRGVSFGAVTADFDGDGDLDLVYSNYQDGISLYRNQESRAHRLVVALHGTRSNRFGLGAVVQVRTSDQIQTRALQPARGYLSSSEPVLHFGLGEASRIDELTVVWPSGTRQVLRNLAADQRLDITESGESANPVAAPSALFAAVTGELGLPEPASASLQEEPNQPALLPFRNNRRGPSVAAGDLDGDGRDELLWGGANGESLRILFFNTEKGRWAPIPLGLPASTLADGPALVVDLNNDGRTDLLVTKGGTTGTAGTAAYAPIYLQGVATGGLAPAPEGSWPGDLLHSVGALAAADIDHDGDLDLFVGPRALPRRYPNTPAPRILLNDGRGRFADVSSKWIPKETSLAPVNSALWTDLDVDGWPDLLVASEWDRVRAWHNEAGRGLREVTDDLGFGQAGRGLWTSLAAGDFNGDGRLDYAAGNIGLNTPYSSATGGPRILLSGDLRGNGGSSLLEVVEAQGRLWPWRARSELGAVFPDLLKKFPTYAAFAAASVDELFAPARLAAARRWEIDQLQSGFFLSQPGGGFRFAPAPRLAQLAPWQGLAVSDWDGDGHLDLLVTQNSRTSLPSLGPFEGGLGEFLRGDGHGGFHCTPPQQSGWMVPGDAEALAALDVDGSGTPSLVVSRHAESPLVFRLQPPTGQTVFQIDLHGVPAARVAGSRVRVEFSEGPALVLGLDLGGSWLGQSSLVRPIVHRAERTPSRIVFHWGDGTRTEQKVKSGENRIRPQVP